MEDKEPEAIFPVLHSYVTTLRYTILHRIHP